MGILAAAGAIGKIAGGLGKGRADGRKAEADVNLQRDQLATSQYATQQGAMLNAARGMADQNLNDAQIGLTAPSMRGRQAVMGDLLANFQHKVPTHARANVIDFGSPVNLSDSTRKLGGLLSSGALADQEKGNSPLEKVDFMSMLMKAPSQAPLPKSSWLDTLLNTAGTVGALAGGAAEAKNAFGGTPSTASQLALINPPKVRFGNG